MNKLIINWHRDTETHVTIKPSFREQNGKEYVETQPPLFPLWAVGQHPWETNINEHIS